jgi:membrane-bound lytic murein transglycosylase B
MRFLVILLALFYCWFPSSALAQDDLGNWLKDFKQDALNAGISESTVTETIDHIELLPNIIKLDLAQPEFISTFLDYYLKRVDTPKIVRGRELLVKYEYLLNQIEAQYGVPKSLLVAFWGMETDYGSHQGNIDTLSALATLAYDGRRATFFQSQLLDAMRIIDAGHLKANQFRGSWAGAFGNMQFMPSTFMNYAIDGDGDKQIDIVNSMADAFASAANYLSKVGWHKGEPIMIEVLLPPNFQWQNAQFNLRKPVLEWVQLGVTAVQGSSMVESKALYQALVKTKKFKAKKRKSSVHQAAYKRQDIRSPQGVDLRSTALPSVNGQAAIVLPQGWKGPAFMVFDNFDVVMDWNRSVNYALSVAQLAKRINGESRILGGQFAEVEALTFEQMFELQAMLNVSGFNAGEPDGFPGTNTQAAIRGYQISQELPADGYASPSLYNNLKSTTDELKTKRSGSF